MFSSVSELLALELSSIIVAGLASIEAFSWTEFDDILRGTSGSLAAGGGACSDSESESETEAAEAAEDLRTSAMTSAFWASSRWTVSRFELTISSFVNSSFLIFTQVIFYEIGTLFLQQNHNMYVVVIWFKISNKHLTTGIRLNFRKKVFFSSSSRYKITCCQMLVRNFKSFLYTILWFCWRNNVPIS